MLALKELTLPRLPNRFEKENKTEAPLVPLLPLSFTFALYGEQQISPALCVIL